MHLEGIRFEILPSTQSDWFCRSVGPHCDALPERDQRRAVMPPFDRALFSKTKGCVHGARLCDVEESIDAFTQKRACCSCNLCRHGFWTREERLDVCDSRDGRGAAPCIAVGIDL